MQLQHVMTRNPQVVAPDTTLQEAAAKMKSLDVGPMPVCEGDRVVGMLTDRDIIVRAVAEGRDPKQTKVRDAMTPDVIACFEDQDANEAARVMADKQVRRVLVLNRQNKLVGIVALSDLAVDTADTVRAGEVVEAVSQPAEPAR
jgi:CBS domain-containing protein